MPTATIVYRTADGAQFPTETAATAHEQLAARVAAAMAPLGKVPQAVEDGKGWLQHSEASYRRAHRAICRLIAPTLESGWPDIATALRDEPDTVHTRGVVGRIMDDASGPLSRAWSRFAHIDAQFREHQQPYYAINGPREEHVCVEDRRA